MFSQSESNGVAYLEKVLLETLLFYGIQVQCTYYNLYVVVLLDLKKSIETQFFTKRDHHFSNVMSTQLFLNTLRLM